MIRLVVEETASERLDAWIARRLPEVSRSQVTQLLEQGHIRIDGRVPKKSEKPAAGDVIEIEIPEPTPTHIGAEEIPLTIVYEDRDIVVIDKPAGMVVHPAPGHGQGTLVNALLHHVTDLSGVGGELRPGIVHRLDKDTSGLLLVAKHDQSHRALSAALKAREIKRWYLAASWGHLREDDVTVDAPIGRSPNYRQKMAIVPTGRNAVTHFHRLERWRGADLLRCQLETGRTHQIRVHLLSIGHPVVGDVTYGANFQRAMSGTILSWARAFAKRVPRQFLHATELSFQHPRTGEAMRFVSELPPELEVAAQWARETS